MSGRVIPIEKHTGIPLAIAPRFDEPPIPSSRNYNIHHAIPRRLFKGSNSIASHALKGARVQYVNKAEHDAFHDEFDEFFDHEFSIPRSLDRRFGMTILLCAGYVPELGLRCAKGQGAEYVDLTESQRNFLWFDNRIRVENEKAITDFIHFMILKHKVNLDPGIAEMFVSCKKLDERYSLGRQILEEIVDHISEPLRDQYREAYVSRLIRPNVPDNPRDFIWNEDGLLGNESQKARVCTLLFRQLADDMGIYVPLVA